MESIEIAGYSETEEYKRIKAECWECAVHGKEINLAKLDAPRYKYFSELYWLYLDVTQKKLTREEAAKRDEQNYREMVEFMNKHLDYHHSCIVMNDNIRKAGEQISVMNKAEELHTAAMLAFEIIGRMTGDTVSAKHNMERFGGDTHV